MKKLIILWFFLAFFIFIPKASAQEQYPDDFKNSVEVKDSLLSDSTDLNAPGSIMKDLEPHNLFSFLWRQICGGFKEYIQTLTQGLAMILASVIISRTCENIQSNNIQTMFSFIVSISIVLMCEGSLRGCAIMMQKAIDDMRVFTSSCIPAFAVVMIAAGEGGGATVFSASMVLLGEVGTLVSNNILLPLMDIYLAIGICSVVSDEYNFLSLSKNIRKFIIWVIGIVVLLFRLILKLQISAAGAGDRMTQKYIRTAVGGLIPIVGGTLSQGVDGLFAAAMGVKTSFAIAGVLIILSVMLPVLITIGVNGLIWSFCRWFAAFMNEKTVCSVSGVLANSFYLMLAIGGSVTLMGLFSFFGIMTQLS